MCRWGCLKTDTTYRCKFCGIRYCINCLCGDFPGKMYAPNLCRRCNQKNHRGQKVSCDDAFSEAAQKVITMQSVIKAAKGGDRNRSYLRLPTKSKGAIDTTIANTNDNNRKKEDDKSRNKKNISEVKSKVDTSSHRKNAQVEQQQSTQKGVAVTEGSKKTKRKSQKLKAKSESTTAQSKPASTAIASQKVVKKVKSKVTGKEDSTKATIKKKQVAA